MENVQKKRGLGMGLDALLGDISSSEVLAQASCIPISRICPNRYQPRSRFSEDELAALTASVAKDGVLMPILVRPKGAGFEIIAGERRWRAAQAAGLLEIPAVLRDVDDLQALELAIVENEQRDDLTAIESARAYQLMIGEFGCTQQQVSERIGKSRTQVTNLIRLLQLSKKIQLMIENRQLDMGHARALVGLPAKNAESLAAQCIAGGWSARQMETHARKERSSAGKTSTSHAIDADVAALQDELTRCLGLMVEIRCRKNGSGEMRIKYSQAAELDTVLKRLRG
ncbi:MAG: ParB/RepB/Spo0J family partition protein [Mariprofundaceae bacterium]|nr:ParB/RepB/Spo0J family partition protein [Mariprofundaceae bacterium]